MQSDNPNIIFGKHSYGDMRIVGGSFGKVSIGKYCSLGGNIIAYMAHDHKTSNISTFPFGHLGMPITKLMKLPLPERREYSTIRKLRVVIGNDVWIGSNAVIFRDINVGDGAVIGAFSTITKDVPPYSVVTGHNTVLRKRFPDKDVEFLLNLKWWDFEDQEVADIAHILCSPNIDALRIWAKENGRS